MQEQKSKICIACKNDKPLAEFRFGEGKKRDRFSSRCISCKQIQNTERWRKTHPIVKDRKANLSSDKWCPGCNLIKPISEYAKAQCRSGGIDSYCILCKRSNNKRYDNKDAKTIRNRQRVAKNRQLDPVTFKMRELMNRAKNRALKSGLPFDLDLEYLVSIAGSTCPVFGIEFDYVAKNGRANPDAPSLDKFVPALGYVKGNVHVICWKANRMKVNSTPDEMMQLALWAKNINEANSNSGKK